MLTVPRTIAASIFLLAAWHQANVWAPKDNQYLNCTVVDIFKGHRGIPELRDGEVRMDCGEAGKKRFTLRANSAAHQKMLKSLEVARSYDVVANDGSWSIERGIQSAQLSHKQGLGPWGRTARRQPADIQTFVSNLEGEGVTVAVRRSSLQAGWVTVVSDLEKKTDLPADRGFFDTADIRARVNDGLRLKTLP